MADGARAEPLRMFVAVYRWRVKPGREEEFAQSWELVTRAIHEECASAGSALFRGDDGTHTAIACWPDRETRERCSADVDNHIATMKDCTEERFPEQRLETVKNLWNFQRLP